MMCPPKDPEAFTTTPHQIKYSGRLPSETESPTKKNISSFGKWIAIVKTDMKALPCVSATQTAAGVSPAVGCRAHLVFLKHHSRHWNSRT